MFKHVQQVPSSVDFGVRLVAPDPSKGSWYWIGNCGEICGCAMNPDGTADLEGWFEVNEFFIDDEMISMFSEESDNV